MFRHFSQIESCALLARNGGQIVNGLNASLETIGRRYGQETARFVATVVTEGGRIIRERVARYAIACDLKDGNLFAAFTARQTRALAAKRALWRAHGHDSFELLDAEAMRRHVATDAYCGGMLDRAGGHLHPLNLALGEAAALERLGGTIHEATPATMNSSSKRTLPDTPLWLALRTLS